MKTISINKLLTIAATALIAVSVSLFGYYERGSVTESSTIHNVAEYGATANDATDDTTAIQNAINAVESNGGGVVYLPAGVYMVNPLTIDSSYVILRGDGRASTLKLIAQNLTILGDHAVVELVGTSSNELKNVVVEYIGIDGNKAAHTGTPSLNMEGIGLDYVRNGTIANNYITNTISEGIDVDYTTTSAIEGNQIYSSGGSGIHMSHGAELNRVVSNYVQGNGNFYSRSGIDQYGTAGKNTFESNISRSNYRNYNIAGAVGSLFGDANLSTGTVTAPDGFGSL